MKKVIAFVCIDIISLLMYAAPQLPNICEVGMPSVLRNSNVRESELRELLASDDWMQSSRMDEYWNVWSDRSHNTTYNDPSESAGKFKELGLNQAVRIAKIDNGYALVYEEPMKGCKYPLISTSATCLGWVKMDNLLLWSSCPTNERGIYHKALLGLDINEQEKNNSDVGGIYQNPMTRDGNKMLVSDMPFYFVMKKEGNGQVLLARRPNLLSGDTEQVLYGWVSSNSFVKWNQRVCLEPNWQLLGTEPLKGKSATVYNKERVKAAAIPLCKVNPKVNNPMTKYRWDSQRMRFPLLEGGALENDEQYHVMAFCSSHECGIPYVFIGDSVAMFSFEGFVDKQMFDINLWKPVLCLTEGGFADLMETMKIVYLGAISGNRKEFVEAWKNLIHTFWPDITDEEMNMKEMKEVMDWMAGITVKTKSINSHTILEIQDEKIVSPDEFKAILSDFKQKYEHLEYIRTSDYMFSVRVNGVKLYWLPVDVMP